MESAKKSQNNNASPFPAESRETSSLLIIISALQRVEKELCMNKINKDDPFWGLYLKEMRKCEVETIRQIGGTRRL